MKRILSIILAAVMMLSIAPVANIFLDTDTTITASAATYYKVVNTGSSGLRLRKGPGTRYATIITMPNGAKVKYLSKSGSFYKVSYTKNSRTYTGWCSSKYLSKTSSSSSSSYVKDYRGDYETLAKYGLEMRKTPSDSASVFTTIPKGTIVQYYGYKKGSSYWAYIYYPEGNCYGWVHANRITPYYMCYYYG